MSKLKLTITLNIIITLIHFLAIYPTSLAQETCLEQAEKKIKPDKKIELVDLDSISISGHLIAVDLIKQQITINSIVNKNIQTFCYSECDIQQIKYKESKIKPTYMLIGIVCGTVLAGLVAQIAGVDNSGGWWEDYNTSIAIGMSGFFGGLFIGTIFPFIFPETKVIQCH